jgi:serine/threonine-protein kinase
VRPWASDGFIYFAPEQNSGLFKVSGNGGTPTEVTRLDRARQEVSHRWPEVLPGNKAVMFTVWLGPAPDEKRIDLQRLDTGERTVLVRGGDTGRYAPSGHIVYARGDELFAVRFNPESLNVSGQAVRLDDSVRVGMDGAQFAIAQSGDLVLLPGNPRRFERRLVWVSRDGSVEPLAAPVRTYAGTVAISPDDRFAAVEIVEDIVSIWLYDFSRAMLTPLIKSGSSQAPRWTPDGTRIAYRGTRMGLRNVWWAAVDHPAKEDRLTSGETVDTPASWSPDGKWLLYFSYGPSRPGGDVWAVRTDGDRQPRPVAATSFGEAFPHLSPDGRWLAYMSSEPGSVEIFVQPFPGPGARMQISTGGGGSPMWSRDGRELFYIRGDDMMAVDVTTVPSFKAGIPRLLFSGRYMGGPGVTGYDVSRDGKRFLRVQPVHPDPPDNQIRVVLNWQEELKQRVPTR